MKFFRKDSLLVPAGESVIEVPRGRSMVGYSRRAFIGFGGAAVAAVASQLSIEKIFGGPVNSVQPSNFLRRIGGYPIGLDVHLEPIAAQITDIGDIVQIEVFGERLPRLFRVAKLYLNELGQQTAFCEEA